MKKLIAISVVFALVAGAVFAVDVSGTVIGTANVIESSTAKGDKVKASGTMDRIRLDGAGETDGSDFGGYIRIQYADWDGNFKPDAAYAWWKPVDQFKLIIGQQSDGFWGKEGVTGWGFNQIAQDTSVATNPGIWYGWNGVQDPPFGNDDISSPYAFGSPYMHNRYTFFEGWLAWGAGMEITPTDMVGINIAIPYHSYEYPGDTKGDPKNSAAYIYKAAIAQFDFKLDFGNIALTYDGGGRAVASDGSGGAIYLYAGLNVIENLGIDVGFSYHLTDKDIADYKHPIGVGIGLKYTADSFGVKFRTSAALAGDDKNTYINTSVMPYFAISDTLSAFINIGLGMQMGDGIKAMTGGNSSTMGWYFNPYLRAGGEWGPSFYAGVKVESPGLEQKGADNVINWSVPISLVVSF